jgi:hypothetical protein
MHEFITQPIPGGCFTPESQVDEAFSVIVTAAEHLAFCGLTELENRLWEMHESLLLLAAAGALDELSFVMQDPNGVFGVRVIIDPYEVSDFEEVDLSTLRLLASPQALGQLDIVCQDSEFVEGLVGANWLPDATDTLSVTLRFNTDNDTDSNDVDDSEQGEEERDDDNSEAEDWR